MDFTDNQYVITRHTDTDHEHIHILANRITFTGEVVSDSQDWKRQEALMRALERDYGLIVEPSSREADRKAPTKGEIEYGRPGSANRVSSNGCRASVTWLCRIVPVCRNTSNDLRLPGWR